MPERRHAADGEAGGGADLVSLGLADLGHVEGVGHLGDVTRCRPEATQTTGSPSATNTIDLAISASWQPTAVAASATVRVEASRRCTFISTPRSRAHSASLSLTHAPPEPRAPLVGRQLDTRLGGELGERIADVVRELVQVPHEVVVPNSPKLMRPA